MLTNVLISVIVGVATALLTTYLAFKRFRAENLWEKRVEAYTRLISAAHEMQRVRDAEIEARRRGGEIAEEYGEKLWKESQEAKRTILQLADAASFLITEEIATATGILKKELDAALDSDSWLDILLKERNALDEYLQKLKIVARKELRA